jgi:hypothetical protein
VALIWLAGAAMFVGYALLDGFPILGRHVIFVIPPLVLVGFLLSENASVQLRAGGVTLVVGLGLLSFWGLAAGDRYAKSEFRDVSVILESCADEIDEILVLAPSNGFQYYLSGETFGRLRLLGLGSDVDALLEVAPGRTRLVVLEDAHYDPNGAVRQAYASAVPSVRWDLPGFAILAHPEAVDCVDAQVRG